MRSGRGRAALVALALVTTLVSVLGGVGVLPTGSATAARADRADRAAPAAAGGAALTSRPVPTGARPDRRVTGSPSTAPSAVPPLPPGSGTGTRVVFSIGQQRVWLVAARGRGEVVRRTYLASGSAYDNLAPGRFEVYSRSRHATGIGDSGTMEYFVRFTRGAHAAIGFHSIPVSDGRPVQTRAQLGTPLSHGCVRQWRPDARALWDFAPVGRTVVVTA